MARPSKYSPEVRERFVRLVQEHTAERGSRWAAIAAIAPKIGCTTETLRRRVRRAEVMSGTVDCRPRARFGSQLEPSRPAAPSETRP